MTPVKINRFSVTFFPEEEETEQLIIGVEGYANSYMLSFKDDGLLLEVFNVEQNEKLGLLYHETNAGALTCKFCGKPDCSVNCKESQANGYVDQDRTPPFRISKDEKTVHFNTWVSDFFYQEEYRITLKELIEINKEVVFDLTHCKQFDLTWTRVAADLQDYAEDIGHSLVLKNVSDFQRNVFKALGIKLSEGNPCKILPLEGQRNQK